MCCVCRPGLRGMYNEIHLMSSLKAEVLLLEAASTCLVIIVVCLRVKGFVVNTFFFRRALLTIEGDCSSLFRPKEGAWSSLNSCYKLPQSRHLAQICQDVF